MFSLAYFTLAPFAPADRADVLTGDDQQAAAALQQLGFENEED